MNKAGWNGIRWKEERRGKNSEEDVRILSQCDSWSNESCLMSKMTYLFVCGMGRASVTAMVPSDRDLEVRAETPSASVVVEGRREQNEGFRDESDGFQQEMTICKRVTVCERQEWRWRPDQMRLGHSTNLRHGRNTPSKFSHTPNHGITWSQIWSSQLRPEHNKFRFVDPTHPSRRVIITATHHLQPSSTFHMSRPLHHKLRGVPTLSANRSRPGR